MMKRFLILLFAVFTASAAFAQYPNAPNKLRLGAQTTGDGLIFRTDSIPDWTPSTINNAWLAVDTLTGNLYSYQGGEWRLEVAGDLRTVYPKVINKSGTNIKRGQPVMVDYTQIIQGDLIRILPADGSGTYAGILTMGIASTDIANNAEGFITWFGYVREVKQSDIAETGVTLNIGDILYLSGTQLGKLTNVEPTAPKLRVTMALVVRKPNANNMTLLVRPNLNSDLGELNDVDLTGLNDGETIVWDSAGGKWIAGTAGSVIDTTVIATRAYVDGKVDSTRLVQDSILVYYIGGAELRRDTISGVGGGGGGTMSSFTLAGSAGTPQTINDGNTLTVAAGVGISTTAGATDQVTVAADTATVLASKTFLSTRGYTTGSGTTGTIPIWSSSTALGNSALTEASGSVTAGGTGFFRLPNGTTAQRPGTPASGMTRYNTSNGALEYYGASAWEVPLKSATETGLGTATRLFYADANGRATTSPAMSFVATTITFGDANGARFVLNTAPSNHLGQAVRINRPSSVFYSAFELSTANVVDWSLGVNLDGFGFFEGGLAANARFLIKPGGNVAIGNTNPARRLHVTGEVRITDLTTNPPTRIVGADANGDLGAITIGSGLTLSNDTLRSTATGTTNLTFTGTSSPITLNSDTGTDVTLTAGTNVTFSQSANNLTINATASAAATQIASLAVSAGQVVLSQFNIEKADNDVLGSYTTYATSDFVADSSYIRYAGTDTIYAKISGSLSFISNAVSNLIIGVSTTDGGYPITGTASYFRTATSGQATIPVMPIVLQLLPNTRIYLNIENTTNNTITLDTFYNLMVEKIN